MDTLNLLNNFIEEHNKMLIKKYNLDDAINEMLYIQNVLKIKYFFLVEPIILYYYKYKIKLNFRVVSMCNFKHITTDTQILKSIKKIFSKLINRYNKYFRKRRDIIYEHTNYLIEIIN
jgi:hypothetical protein